MPNPNIWNFKMSEKCDKRCNQLDPKLIHKAVTDMSR